MADESAFPKDPPCQTSRPDLHELGESIAKLPLRFARAIILGCPSHTGDEPILYTATTTLVDLGAGPLALTSRHVLKKFFDLRRADPRTTVQIGEVVFDPSSRLLPGPEAIDLVAIDLQGLAIERIRSEAEIGSTFFSPNSWPPPRIREGDYVSVGGFPGLLRTRSMPRRVDFSSLSIATNKVGSVAEDHFVVQFERDSWVKAFDHTEQTIDLVDFRDLGGISGGPAFIERKTVGGVSVFDLVGIVYEFSEAFDLLFVAHADLLDRSGAVRKPG